MKNIFNNNKIFNKTCYKWFLLILNDFILAISIYFFILGPRLNNGGLDGLSLLTLQIINFFFNFCLKDKWIFIFIFFYNLITLLLGYKCFGKKFFKTTIFLALFLDLCFFILYNYISDDTRNDILSKFFIFTKNDNGLNSKIISFMISSFLGGLLIGYTLSNIRILGYNTGGMDILQKILKDIYGLNYILVLLFTDGIIIFFSSLIEGKMEEKNLLNDFFIRLFFSYFSLIIVGFLMEKRDYLSKKNNN